MHLYRPDRISGVGAVKSQVLACDCADRVHGADRRRTWKITCIYLCLVRYLVVYRWMREISYHICWVSRSAPPPRAGWSRDTCSGRRPPLLPTSRSVLTPLLLESTLLRLLNIYVWLPLMLTSIHILFVMNWMSNTCSPYTCDVRGSGPADVRPTARRSSAVARRPRCTAAPRCRRRGELARWMCIAIQAVNLFITSVA